MKIKKRIAAIIAIATIASASSIAPAQADPSAVLFVGDFETCDFTGWNNMVGGNPNTITTEVVRSGRCAMKSELDYYKNVGTNYKNEAAPDTGGHKWNTDYWYGFSVYLPTDWDDDGVQWNLIFQIHQMPDPGEPGASPPLALEPGVDGEWRIWRRWFADAFNPTTTVNQASYRVGPTEKGVWTDWVFHVKWSYTGSGLLEVWKNGTQVVDVVGAIGYNNVDPPYEPKLGIYLGWRNPLVATHRTVYHDEFRMAGPGGSYADVAPRSSAVKLNAPRNLVVQ